MDYEKKYKEALSKAKELSDSNPSDEGVQKWIQDTFPELRESEDERIRKALIEMVHDTTGDELWVDYNVHKEDALAWLKKNIGISEATKKELENNLNKALEKETPESWNEFLEKQGEQKPQRMVSAEAKEAMYNKPAWSEEDESWFKEMELMCLYFSKDTDYRAEFSTWLKSLKDRYAWKLSDEQMKALKQAVDAEIVEVEDNNNSMYSYTHLEICTDEDLSKICKVGDKAKVIIIKQK